MQLPFPLEVSMPEPIVRNGILYGATTDEAGVPDLVRATERSNSRGHRNRRTQTNPRKRESEPMMTALPRFRRWAIENQSRQLEPGSLLHALCDRPLWTCFNLARAVRIASLAAFLVLAGACDQGQTAGGDAILAPRVTSTSSLPLSESDEIALLADERTACVVDSYETQVRCIGVDGAVVGVFGQEGEGPGEFGRASYLARGEEGTVGVHDSEQGRFTVFEPSGAYVSEVMTPVSRFIPLRSFGTTLSGVEVDIMVMLGRKTSGSLMTRFDVNITTGVVVRKEASPTGPWDVACGEVTWGIPDWAAGWVFLACEGHLIFFGDTGAATVLRAPTYLAELPDERDVARFEEFLMAFNRRRGLPASESVDEELESYRATPKRYFLGTEHQLVDAADRYWVATQRDTHEWSYLDLYENAEYVGSVKVRDRLRAFDLLGSTLVVLVERRVGPDDADGIPDRALDWYDVQDLPFNR